MTKEEYLAICSSRYEELEALKSKDNFYDYEVGLEQILNDFGRQYLESALNEKSVTENRRKKNTNPIWGAVHQQVSSIHASPPSRLRHQSSNAGVDGLCRPYRMLR